MRIDVLGPLVVTDGTRVIEIAAPKQRAVLTVLALRAGHPAAVSELIDGVWGDRSPPTAVTSLRSHVSRLRALIGREVVRSTGTGYLLALPDRSVDVIAFERGVEHGRQAMTERRWDRALDHFVTALGRWRGEPLSDLAEGALAAGAVARLRELFAGAQEGLAEAHLRSGAVELAIADLEALVEDEPLREARWTLLVEALYAAGRQADSLRTYQRARARLADELGVEPGPALQDMEQRVLRHDPSLSSGARRGAPGWPPSGTVTLLLTDVEGSAALWDGHPELMAAAVARQTAAIDEVVDRRGGHMLKDKGEGDSTFCVFTDPDCAVTAALEIRERLGHGAVPGPIVPGVRIAVATGRCELRDDDYFGPHVNRAARIRGTAAGGEVVLSSATYHLTADTVLREWTVTDLGPVMLRGLQRPERIWRVEPGTDDAEPELPLDPVDVSDLSWVPTSIGGFAGRRSEWTQLLAEWSRAIDGAGSFVLISGEPGVGKTHLAGQLAHRALQDGGAVLFGRCPPEGADRALVQLIDSYVAAAPMSRLATQIADVGPLAAELSRVTPTLVERVPGLGQPFPTDPEEARRRLDEAIGRFIEVIAANVPLLVVLDDLHWAGAAVLSTIRHLVSALDPAAAVLVVGTYRNTDLDRRHPLAHTLHQLRHEEAVVHVELRGLDAEGVLEFVRTAAGHDLDSSTIALAAGIGHEAAGNPLFVGAVLSHLVEQGGIVRRDGRWVPVAPLDRLPIPEGLTEVIGRRLDTLSEDANTALRTAAVIGTRFDLNVLSEVCRVRIEVIDALDEAVTAGLLVEPAAFGTYEFTHALIRSNLLDELTITRRVTIHWAVGQALRRHGNVEDAAHHLLEGHLAGDAVVAAAGAHDAACAALEGGDLEGALLWSERALAVLDDGTAPASLLAGLHVVRARSSLQWEASERGRSALVDALWAAQRAGDVEGISAVAVGQWVVSPGIDAPELLDALESALRSLPSTARRARCRVLASLSMLYGYGSYARADWERCLDEALELADPTDVHGTILLGNARFNFAGGHPRVAGRDDGFEAMFDSLELDDVSVGAAVDWITTRGGQLGASGHFRELLAEVDDFHERHPQLPESLNVIVETFRVGALAALGEIHQAIEQIEQLSHLWAALGAEREWVDSVRFVVIGSLALPAGFAADLIPVFETLEDESRGIAWNAGAASALAAAGRSDAARCKIDDAMAGLDRIAPINYSHALVLLAHAAAGIGHLAPLPELRDRMMEYPDFLASNGWGCWAAGRHALGWTAAALGEYELACEEYERAIELYADRGLRVLHAWAQQDLAELLDDLGQHDRARALASTARDTSTACGAAAVAERAERLVSSA